MYVMKADIPVFQFDVDAGLFKVLHEDLLPIRIRGAIREGDSRLDFIHNYEVLIDFLSRRVLSLDRKNAKKILNAYNFSQSQSPVDKAKIAIVCRAVSVIDDYWIKDEKCEISWDSLDLKKVSLSDVVTQISLCGTSLTLQGIPHTPELTGHGSYAKAWVRETDGLFLYKRSASDGIESDIEISVSKILDCFNVNHVKYLPAVYNGIAMCKCKNMATDSCSLVYAEDYFSFCNRHKKEFLTEALRIDADNIYKMCIVDYLISNSDRHMQNWGFFMNNSTGRILCCHPLYDHNNAFDTSLLQDAGESQVFLGESKRTVANRAMRRCNFGLVSDLNRSMFLNSEFYDSFTKRAEELGLVKIKNRFFRGIGLTELKRVAQEDYDSKLNTLLEQDRDEKLNSVGTRKLNAFS